MLLLLRYCAGAAAIGLWLALYFLGRTAGGAIHLLPLAALALLLWPVRVAGSERSPTDSETLR
ncbi:MAG: hypothetical protein ABIV06_01930 [Thermoanaerobaculia bacterium]